jgi:hypothetical protein
MGEPRVWVCFFLLFFLIFFLLFFFCLGSRAQVRTAIAPHAAGHGKLSSAMRKVDAALAGF